MAARGDWLGIVGAVALVASPVNAEPWVGATPEATLAHARAGARGSPEGGQLAARLALIAAIAPRAPWGAGDRELAHVGGPDARWLRRALACPEAPPAEEEEEEEEELSADALDDDGTGPDGLVRTWAVLGPLDDVGGGLDVAEGPEVAGFEWQGADASRGAILAHPVRTGIASVDARGVDLDRYVSPRAESCSYLAARVELPRAEPIRLSIASSGAVRVLWDGTEVIRDAQVHGEALLDRAAARIEGTAGAHRVVVKQCTGSRPDSGRVRVRLAREDGSDLRVATSSALADLDAVPARSVKTTLLGTALSEALAPPEGASRERLLAAAVAARLAGADDLRASRVSGWLDRATGDGAAPEALAVAGYVGPFYAQRTGWLLAAWREGEPGVASFAQRALVEARLAAGADDLAERAVAEAPLVEAEDLDAQVLHARVKGAVGGAGLEARARLDLAALTRSAGAVTPTSTYFALASLDGLPTSTWAVHRELARRHHMAWEAWVGLARLGGDASFSRAARWALPRVTSAEEANAIAAGLLQHGHLALARAAYAETTRRTPNDPEAWEGLARASAQAGAPGAAIITALERAIELAPSPALEAQLRFRRGEALEDGPDLGEDARWIVPAETFVARAEERGRDRATPGVRARQLHWRRVVRHHPDQRVSQLMHWAREVVEEPTGPEERYEELPPGELLVARVHRRDGTVAEPEERDDDGPTVRWPALKRGDVVEVAVRMWAGPVGRRGDAPFFFIDYVGAHDTEPVVHNEVVIDVPDGSPFVFDVVNGKPDQRRTERVGDRTVTRLVWASPPAVRDEPLAPPLSETLPLVVGSIYPGWDRFDAWYRSATEGFTRPDVQIERLANELTAGRGSRAAKIEALYTFVTDSIRYVNFRSGEWWLPNRPQDLLARRQGDCDDKSMLLVSLLRAAGIEAEEVLIQTRFTGSPAGLGSERAAIPLFDHGIVYLPGEGRYVDPTTPETRMDALPAADAGAPVMRVGHPRIARTPVGRPADHGVAGTWTVNVASDGSARFEAEERHAGDAAFELRRQLAEPDARQPWLEQRLLTGWFSGLALAPAIDFDGDLDDGAAKLGFRGRVGRLGWREGDAWVLPLGPTDSFANALARLPQRTLPVVLPPDVSPRHQRRTTTFVAPEGYLFAPPPPGGTAEAPGHGRWSLRFTPSRDRRRVEVEQELELSSIVVPVADYPAWRRFLQRADALRRRTLRLVPVAK